MRSSRGLAALLAALCAIFTTQGASAYVGPQDIYSTSIVACYSTRACSAAIAAAGTAKMFNLIRASDSQTCDFIVATGGGVGNSANCSGAFGSGSLATFCNATTCKVTAWYDQNGDATEAANQATGANQPTLVVSCVNGLPCIQGSTANGSVGLVTSALSALTQPVSYSVVAIRTTTGSFDVLVADDNSTGSFITFQGSSSTANAWVCYAGVTGLTLTSIPDNAWHPFECTVNGASSNLNAGGSTIAGNAGAHVGYTARGVLRSVGGGDGLAGSETEVLVFNSAMSVSNQNLMCANQAAYWALTTTCAGAASSTPRGMLTGILP